MSTGNQKLQDSPIPAFNKDLNLSSKSADEEDLKEANKNLFLELQKANQKIANL